MRILVSGSRYGWDPDKLREGLGLALRKAIDNWPDLGPGELGIPVLVHGDARGVDKQAARIWQSWGYSVEAHPARWSEYGSGAGPIRNQHMVDSGIDYGIAFLDDDSRGTKDCIERANKARIPMLVYTRRD